MGYSERFERFFPNLAHNIEGFHDADLGRGGDTVWGIARKFHPEEPWPPSYDRCKEIYFDEYYTPMQCEAIVNERFSFVFFVAAVNIGTGDAKQHIWTLLNMPLNGQIIGKVTLANLNAALEKDWDKQLCDFMIGMNHHYFNLHRSDPVKYPLDILEGWMNRQARALNL